jgi:hypothetical protein
LDENQKFTYWSGFCWDKAGTFTQDIAWLDHVTSFAQSIRSPIKIDFTPQ